MSAAWQRVTAPEVNYARFLRAWDNRGRSKSEPVRRRWRLPWFISTRDSESNSTGCPPTPWSADTTPHATPYRYEGKSFTDTVHQRMGRLIWSFAGGLAEARCQLAVAKRWHAASASPNCQFPSPLPKRPSTPNPMPRTATSRRSDVRCRSDVRRKAQVGQTLRLPLGSCKGQC
jgi:hypothetical protein